MAARRGLVETRPTGHGRARGLVSSRVSGRRVDAHTYAAPDDLADVVAVYWSGRWDLRGQPPHTTELLGDPCVHLVFEEGGVHAGSRLVGVWTRLWRRTLEGRGQVRGVKLRAGAVRAFVDRPAVQLANQIVPLRSIFGAGIARLEAAVLRPADDGDAFATLETWLRARRLRRDQAQMSLAVALVDRVARDREITLVEHLAAASGLAARGLQRLFRDHVGASPKSVIRRFRLQEAALRIERGEPPTLAALAADLGYTDQAHLARDFKSVVGRSPRDFSAAVHR
jgi:AraC-like DNA-binding protein